MSLLKPSPIKLRNVLLTIEKIALINNEDEKNPVLNDIYRISHAFTARCKNLHEDWRLLSDELSDKLKSY